MILEKNDGKMSMNRGRKEHRRMNNKNVLLDEQNYKHENKERLCYCCNQLQESSGDLIKHKMSGRAYMSEFDSMEFTIQLCEQCNADMEVEEEWFDNDESFDEVTGQWINEAYIINMVETFPIHNQEYVYNSVNHLCPPHDIMDRVEWIKLQQD